MLDRSLMNLSLVGAHAVLELLLVLSVLSIALMVERALFYVRRRLDTRTLGRDLEALLAAGDLEAARDLVTGSDAMPARVVGEGLRALADGATASELMDAELGRQRARFEARLMFLGTLGNNAPFLGLFGTVLGIIKAFHDLSLNDPSKAGAGAQAVMAGVSEALVATAVGLAVALPAVVAFNYFKSVVKRSAAASESLMKVVAAYAPRLAERAREAA